MWGFGPHSNSVHTMIYTNNSLPLKPKITPLVKIYHSLIIELYGLIKDIPIAVTMWWWISLVQSVEKQFLITEMVYEDFKNHSYRTIIDSTKPNSLIKIQLQTNIIKVHNYTIIHFKGVLHLWPLLWLFMQFSPRLHHIGDKLDMFLIGNILKNLITTLEIH